MFKKPFVFEFDEFGGYDCMSSGYVVYDAKKECVLSVSFGGRDDHYGEDPEMLRVTEIIVKALNKEY